MAAALPPSAQMLQVCDTVETLIEAFLAARITVMPQIIAKYEASKEALSLFNLAIRHVEGVLQLSRSDAVLLPPAIVSARAAFESAVKAAWLVDADDLMDREARWLCHLQSEERFLERGADRLADSGIDLPSLRGRAETIRSFRERVAAKLPSTIKKLNRTPTFEDMLTSIGGKSLYVHYIETSQFAHAEHAATWLYRSNGLGAEAQHGEYIKPYHWWLPFRLSWLSLTRPAQVLLTRLGATESLIKSIPEILQLDALSMDGRE